MLAPFNICASHSLALQSQIKHRGLWDLCPLTEAEFHKWTHRLTHHASRITLSTFSPFHYALGIISHMRSFHLQEFPYDAMADGEACPICCLDPDDADFWLSIAAESARNVATDLLPTNAAVLILLTHHESRITGRITLNPKRKKTI